MYTWAAVAGEKGAPGAEEVGKGSRREDDGRWGKLEGLIRVEMECSGGGSVGKMGAGRAYAVRAGRADGGKQRGWGRRAIEGSTGPDGRRTKSEEGRCVWRRVVVERGTSPGCDEDRSRAAILPKNPPPASQAATDRPGPPTGNRARRLLARRDTTRPPRCLPSDRSPLSPASQNRPSSAERDSPDPLEPCPTHPRGSPNARQTPARPARRCPRSSPAHACLPKPSLPTHFPPPAALLARGPGPRTRGYVSPSSPSSRFHHLSPHAVIEASQYRCPQDISRDMEFRRRYVASSPLSLPPMPPGRSLRRPQRSPTPSRIQIPAFCLFSGGSRRCAESSSSTCSQCARQRNTHQPRTLRAYSVSHVATSLILLPRYSLSFPSTLTALHRFSQWPRSAHPPIEPPSPPLTHPRCTPK